MPTDTRKLAAKTSRTLLAAQRRDFMEQKRLSAQLERAQAEHDWQLRAWGREYRQAEQQLSLGNLVLSDDVISVDAISKRRPRAPSASERVRQLSRGPRQRRPASVFKAQAERELLPERPACQFPGACGRADCRHFPCALPSTYSFLGNKREMLRLYELVLRQLPEHRRPRSGASDTSDLSSLISDAEFVIAEQSQASALDPVERARLLKQAVEDWKKRHARQKPEPREARYGKPYPMRRVLKPISCSSSFFLN